MEDHFYRAFRQWIGLVQCGMRMTMSCMLKTRGPLDGHGQHGQADIGLQEYILNDQRVLLVSSKS